MPQLSPLEKIIRPLIIGLVFLSSAFNLQAEEGSPPWGSDLNVILIVVDTLATKHIGGYNKDINFTPNIKKLADSGVTFLNAYSPAPWTKPSVASMFTGKYPSKHKVVALNDRLPQSSQVMAEVLKNLGYSTGGVISHTLINAKAGYGKGFDSYEIVPFKGNVHDSITADQVTSMGKKWLESHLKNRPKQNFFLFLHYFDPHYNYQHHPKFDLTSGYKGSLKPGTGFRILRKKIPELKKPDLDYLVGLYREEIAYTDSQIGVLMEYLKESGAAKNTLVIFTADHGEEFLEHGKLGHTATLYNELINIPLIYSLPGHIKPAVSSEPVSSMDTLPTVLEVLGKSALARGLDGVSLTKILRGESGYKERELISEVDFKSTNIEVNKLGVIKDGFKLVLDKRARQFELYDLSKDPEEKVNLSERRTDILSGLSAKLLYYEEQFQRPLEKSSGETLERTPEEVEQLKSLGYM